MIESPVNERQTRSVGGDQPRELDYAPRLVESLQFTPVVMARGADGTRERMPQRRTAAIAPMARNDAFTPTS